MDEVNPKTLITNYLTTTQLKTILPQKSLTSLFPVDLSNTTQKSIYYSYESEMKDRLNQVKENIKEQIPDKHWNLLGNKEDEDEIEGEYIEQCILYLQKIEAALNSRSKNYKQKILKLVQSIEHHNEQLKKEVLIGKRKLVDTEQIMKWLLSN